MAFHCVQMRKGWMEEGMERKRERRWTEAERQNLHELNMLCIKWCSVLRRKLSSEALEKKVGSIDTLFTILVAGLGDNTGDKYR